MTSKERKDTPVLYSTGCPKCKVLKKKLDGKHIPYEENHSVDDMMAMGMKTAPALKVGDRLLDFSEANRWIDRQEGTA